MREIKFRAWDGNRMIYQKDRDYRFNPEDGFNQLAYRPITALQGDGNDYMWMQYTGFKDKNGVEIYEGDIVKYTRTNMYCPSASFHNKDLVDNVEIYWDNERMSMSSRTIDLSRKNQPPYSSSGYIGFYDKRADERIVEIIGNIYQNKELLQP